jgi:hypothetical protein
MRFAYPPYIHQFSLVAAVGFQRVDVTSPQIKRLGYGKGDAHAVSQTHNPAIRPAVNTIFHQRLTLWANECRNHAGS